jgi:hypothetical protein
MVFSVALAGSTRSNCSLDVEGEEEFNHTLLPESLAADGPRAGSEGIGNGCNKRGFFFHQGPEIEVYNDYA